MSIEIDMNKARDTWRQKIREKRQPVLERLDIDYLRAIETQNGILKSSIENKKQALRDATSDERIERATSAEILKLIDPVTEIITATALENAKISKLQEVDESWKSSLKMGWATPQGWRLGIDLPDVTLLMGLFTLAKEASSLGITSPITVIDTEGNSHELQLPEFTLIMLAYGQARSALSTADAQKRKAIMDATTVEEVNAIQI